MAKLIMCKGLPGSGKSTWAIDQCLNSLGMVVRVNKDDIRAEFEQNGWQWSREGEKEVLKRRDALILDALAKGFTVISDDTNLAPKHETQLKLLAKLHDAEFEVKSFLDVRLDECIRRDNLRTGKARVGERVIRGMANQLPNEPPQVVPYVNDPTLPQVIICDLDGTLAIHNGRSPFDFQKCDTDLLNVPIRDLIWCMNQHLITPVYLSGRDDIVKDKTQAWLDANECAKGPLYMRVTGDKRNDAVVKRELLDNHVKGVSYVRFVLDDRDRVVKMWREIGLTCLQVNYGAF